MLRQYVHNPRYLEFRGKPLAVVGSGEHYGAVLNLDFDYRPYLDTLAVAGLNQLRLFSGTYREIPGEFGIVDNNLAPAPGRFCCPWKPVGEKWSLEEYDDACFARLRDFVSLASERAILVEYVLFCFWYNANLWQASPMHPRNNTQGIGPEDKEQVYTLQNNPLLPFQESFVRKAVTELNAFDNVYYEVCNEPYSRHDHTMYDDWQHRIADVIAETEKSLPNRHLIAINYQNRTRRIENPHPEVALCNFHYALPEAARENYHLARVIADDETGFAGQSAQPYRVEAWRFLFSGGGLFGHLDYSFTCRHPDGSAPILGTTPGYGGADLRAQLSYLRKLLEEIEVWRLTPLNEAFAWDAGTVHGQIMGDPGRLYALYLWGKSPEKPLLLGLPPGTYALRWLDPKGCREMRAETCVHAGGYLPLPTPAFEEDAALIAKREA